MAGCNSPNARYEADFSSGKIYEVTQPKTETYPEWFWNMPYSDNTLFAVGFSETSIYHPESSEESAIEDGLKSLAKFLAVRIKSEDRSFTSLGMDIQDFTDDPENIAPETEEYVKENYTAIAKFVSPKNTFILLKLGREDSSKDILSSGLTGVPSRPLWVTDPPKDERYIYATGESNLYLREIDSWKKAERNAIIALAFIVDAKVKSLIADSEMESYNTSSISTDTELKNVQLISRWKDEKQKTCHVLVRMFLMQKI